MIKVTIGQLKYKNFCKTGLVKCLEKIVSEINFDKDEKKTIIFVVGRITQYMLVKVCIYIVQQK